MNEVTQGSNKFVSIYSYNKLSAENENLKLILSNKNKKIEDLSTTIDEHNKGIEILQKSVTDLKNQLDILKQKQQSHDLIISQNETWNREIYNALSMLRIDNNILAEVLDPKSAIIKINETQRRLKSLTLQANENNILLLSLGKILNCEDVKLIQTLKDMIHNSEVQHKKSQKFQQFFERSMDYTNGLCSDLYRSGTISTPVQVTMNNIGAEESVRGWGMRIDSVRKSCLNAAVSKPDQMPSFTKRRCDTLPAFQQNLSSGQNDFMIEQMRSSFNFPPPGMYAQAGDSHQNLKRKVNDQGDKARKQFI